MNSKIIGFLITKEKFKPSVDFFDAGINVISVNHAGYSVYLWGFGDFHDCKIDGHYSLSYPLKVDLMDRNILISLNDGDITVQNDWLGSIPVFYNTKDGIISSLFNFCLKDKEIHAEGLSNFCEFGYSVFEQTPFKHIKFMRFYSKLTISRGEINVEQKPDPVLDKSFLADVSDEGEVVSLMNDYISRVEDATSGDIILPTSGGYDSRILNYFIKDKGRVKSFTYGISRDQSISTEVANAKRISEIYHTSWSQVELKEFHKYIDEWVKIYGSSTHLHGMYHIEFYRNFLKVENFISPTFLSGIVGDAWAGSINYGPITNSADIISLAYTHNLNLKLEHLVKPTESKLKEKYFDAHKSYFHSDKIKAVCTIRLKLILISYLTHIPEYFGLPVWTPFLNFEIVKKTLNLPEEFRRDRIWQKEFFRRVGLDLESMGLASDKSNNLDFYVAEKAVLEPINIMLMSEYFNEEKLNEINSRLRKQRIIDRVENRLLKVPKLGGVLRRLGCKNHYLESLHDYYVIKAIEKGILYES